VTRAAWPVTAGITAVLIGGALFAVAYDFGPLSRQMALHIALMNVVAPMAAILVTRQAGVGASRAASLWVVAAIQVALLWGWHAPALQRHAMGSHAVQGVMHVSLLAIALWFWCGLLRLAPASRWHAVAVLLLTGKFACLLAVLLIFAPRLLYDFPAHGTGAVPALADQQLAGLLMAAACPLSYVIAGVIVVIQMIGDLGLAADTPRRRPLSAVR
jgi:putative membrane protein